MFYEERVVNGVLCCRTSPDGEWRPATSSHAAAVNALMVLTDDERLAAFGHFCKHYGAMTQGANAGTTSDAQRRLSDAYVL